MTLRTTFIVVIVSALWAFVGVVLGVGSLLTCEPGHIFASTIGLIISLRIMLISGILIQVYERAMDEIL